MTDAPSPERVKKTDWSEQERRGWVRAHWCTFMLNADLPDIPNETTEEVGKVWRQETERLVRLIETRLPFDYLDLGK